MNKFIKSIITATVILSFLISLTSCAKRQEAYSPLYPHPELPSEEIQQRILDCYNESIGLLKSFDHLGYYGEFNGCHVMLTLGIIDTDKTITVADYTFHRNSAFSINAYKDGEIKTINEAYDSGWLTKDDIAYLSNYHKYAGLPAIERAIPADIPANLKPGKLDKETKAKFEFVFKDLGMEPKDVKHYGNYDGVVVFFWEYGEKKDTEQTAKNGEVFSNDRKFEFILYTDRAIHFTSRSASMLDDYLSDEAIKTIAKYHKSINK